MTPDGVEVKNPVASARNLHALDEKHAEQDRMV